MEEYGSLCSVRRSLLGFKELCLGLVFLFQCLSLFCWVPGPSLVLFLFWGSRFATLDLAIDLVLGDGCFWGGCLGELL